MSAVSTLSSPASSVNPASDAGPANLLPLHPRKVVAAKRKCLSTRAWSTLCALASYANKSDICWPKILTLAQDEGVSRSTINRAVRELVDAGYLVRNERPGTSNRWHLLFDPFDLASQARPERVIPPPKASSQPPVTWGGVTDDMPPPQGTVGEGSGYTELSLPPPLPEPLTSTEGPPQEAPVPGAEERTPSTGDQDTNVPAVSTPTRTPDPDARGKAAHLIGVIRETHLRFLANGPSPYPRNNDDIREWYPALRLIKRIPAGPDRDSWFADLLDIVRAAHSPDSWWAGKIPWVLNVEKSLPRLLLLHRATRQAAEQQARFEEHQRLQCQAEAIEAKHIAIEQQRPDDERQERRASIQQRIRAAIVQARREGLSGMALKKRVEQFAHTRGLEERTE